jgi:cell division GTPase FtsZ
MMKLVAIGFGQCGCNIADQFYSLNRHAKAIFNRRIEILTEAFAINTDETDLGGFRHIPRDRHHRIVIGGVRTFGHGVGKMNLDAAKIIKESHSVITDNVLDSRKFHESDGVIAIASGGGGTGSGAIGWAIKKLKERIEKPVYAAIVLPFEYEENGLTSYAVTNTATCLRTVNQYADAVFLLDNERFARRDESFSRNLYQINHEFVNNFYDLFCAGEEKRRKYVGSKVVDAGDIKQSLEGITSIGRGQINLGTFRRLDKEHFREEAKESSAVAGALDKAMNNLSASVNLEDARRILILLTAPRGVITLNALEAIATLLQEKAPKAVVRMGDYPRRGKEVSLTLLVSGLARVARVENLFTQATDLLKKQTEIHEETQEQVKEMHQTGDELPTLD